VKKKLHACAISTSGFMWSVITKKRWEKRTNCTPTSQSHCASGAAASGAGAYIYRSWSIYLVESIYLQELEHLFTGAGAYIYCSWSIYLQELEHQELEHIFSWSIYLLFFF